MKTIFIIAKTKYTLKYERKMPEKEVLKMKSLSQIKEINLLKLINLKLKKFLKKTEKEYLK
jgi:hypothetical protein